MFRMVSVRFNSLQVVLRWSVAAWLWAAVSAYAQVSTGSVTVQFTKDLYSVNEPATSAVVLISRSGSTNDSVSVEVTASDDTASAGPGSGMYKTSATLLAGKTEERVRIPIKRGLRTEGDKV